MKLLTDALLYGIVDLGYVTEENVARVAEQMIAGGVDVVQLRAKGRSEADVKQLGRILLAVTRAAGLPLIINDYPELVAAVGAQGVHVGQDDCLIGEARECVGRERDEESGKAVVGKSTHSLEQALAAQRDGADYIGFGPLFATPTKPGRRAIGLTNIRMVHKALTIPVFCIGGIKRDNLDKVLDAGARRVVIVSGILQAADIASYCRDVKAQLLEIADCGSAPAHR